MISLSDLQKQVYQNKIDKGFDIRDNKENIYKQFCYMQGELSEAFEAYHKNLGNLGEELADVVLYILGLCEIKKIDLETEILKKLEVIKKRKYVKINGSMIKEEKLTKEQLKEINKENDWRIFIKL